MIVCPSCKYHHRIEKQYELLFQMQEYYEQIMHVEEETFESIKTILHELDTIGVWQRSLSAVTLDGIKNILPDIKLFFKNLYIILSTYMPNLVAEIGVYYSWIWFWRHC